MDDQTVHRIEAGERVTLVAVYDSLDDAQRARDMLIEAGARPDDITVDVADDEAGALAGNFVAGNGREGVADPYRENFAAPRQSTNCVMTLRVDAAARERAQAIVERCGARIAA